MNKALLIGLLCFSFSCKNAKDSTAKTIDIKSIINTALSENASCLENSDGSKVLCQVSQKNKPNHGYGVTFIVVSKKNGEIIVKDSVDKGTVAWFSDNELSLFYTPGIMRENDSRDNYTFIYNLDTKSKTKKTDLNK